MSVVGLDVGNLNCYVSVAKQGGIEVVTNEYSVHPTPSVIQFGAKCRTIGMPAKNAMLSNLQNTVYNFKNLIGRKYSDPIVQAELPFLPYTVIRVNKDDIGIQIDFLQGYKVLTMEQVTAILLQKLKETAEAHLGSPVCDCVLSVPSFWTDTQRRCLLDATKIAELNCLQIINDTAAVALTYGMYKSDLPDSGYERPKLVAFIDVGHVAAQGSIVAFHKGKLNILASTYDLGFGGREMDRLIRHYFTHDFKTRYNVDSFTKPRAYERLLIESEKVKKLMSTNQQTLPVNIECFMNDKDVSGKIDRQHFEDLCSPLFPRFAIMLHNLIRKSKIDKGDLSAVEMVGGCSRVPRLKQIVTDVFGMAPDSTVLNQDDAVSRGAALQCAILSPAYRVRPFAVNDRQLFPIRLEWDKTIDSEAGNMIVFNQNDEIPCRKILSFERTKPFILKAYYDVPSYKSLPYADSFIGAFEVTNILPPEFAVNNHVKVGVQMDANGIFSVTCAAMHTIDNIREKRGLKYIRFDEKELENEDNEQWKGGQKGGKCKGVELNVDDLVPQLSRCQLANFIDQERYMKSADSREREKADARNALESYVYEMRDKLSADASGKLHPFARDEELIRLLTDYKQVEGWIYSDGADVTIEEYKEKLHNLKKRIERIEYRHSQSELRASAFRNLRTSFLRVRKFLQAYDNGDPLCTHINPHDVEELGVVLRDKEQWCAEKEEAQRVRSLNVDPIVTSYLIQAEQEGLEQVANPILARVNRQDSSKLSSQPPSTSESRSENKNEQPKKHLPGIRKSNGSYDRWQNCQDETHRHEKTPYQKPGGPFSSPPATQNHTTSSIRNGMQAPPNLLTSNPSINCNNPDGPSQIIVNDDDLPSFF